MLPTKYHSLIRKHKYFGHLACLSPLRFLCCFYSTWRPFATSFKEISQPWVPLPSIPGLTSTSFFTPLLPDCLRRCSYEINYKLNKLIIWEFYDQYFPLLQTQISLIFQLINDEKRFKAIKVYSNPGKPLVKQWSVKPNIHWRTLPTRPVLNVLKLMICQDNNYFLLSFQHILVRNCFYNWHKCIRLSKYYSTNLYFFQCFNHTWCITIHEYCLVKDMRVL